MQVNGAQAAKDVSVSRSLLRVNNFFSIESVRAGGSASAGSAAARGGVQQLQYRYQSPVLRQVLVTPKALICCHTLSSRMLAVAVCV